MTNVVEITEVTKRFRSVVALDTLSLAIESNTVFGVIGPNGAGKTTLMRLLLDVIRPTSGRVRVLGQNPRSAGAALRRRIGFLPGETHFNPKLSGSDHLRFWSRLGPAVDRHYLDSLTTRFDFDLTRRVGTLSKGNKQKLGIIQAFMHKPELLILDEPTSGLDPVGQQIFIDCTREAQQRGATIILSSHIVSEIEQIAQQAAVLRHGQLVRNATIDELRQSLQRHVKARLRGDSLPGVREELTACNLPFDVHDDGDTFTVTGLIEGRSNDVVAFFARHDLVDLVITEPALADSLRTIYGKED
ncbi:ABC transporter ATP-binding protein [Schaalia suimastitidis]|uniref:ABC transporter ATP-binding protein n=1 Tax=Schaalia suimastitidis TaxID=121163 RepID=UPI0004170151|nr:ABC transporter ATP-binding protein [Schaalia suimastitidis]